MHTIWLNRDPSVFGDPRHMPDSSRHTPKTEACDSWATPDSRKPPSLRTEHRNIEDQPPEYPAVGGAKTSPGVSDLVLARG